MTHDVDMSNIEKTSTALVHPESSRPLENTDLSALENELLEGVRSGLADIFNEHVVAMDRAGATAYYSVPLGCPCTYCNRDDSTPDVLRCILELRRRRPELTGEPLYMISIGCMGGIFCETWEGEPEAIPAKMAFIVGVMAYHSGLQAGMDGL